MAKSELKAVIAPVEAGSTTQRIMLTIDVSDELVLPGVQAAQITAALAEVVGSAELVKCVYIPVGSTIGDVVLDGLWRL